MKSDICVDLTAHRKLDFCSSEENRKKEVVFLEDNDGEKLINKCDSTISEEKILEIGMEFDSEEEAYKFYNEYAKAIGFGIGKHNIHNDVSEGIIDRTFCCACQGHRVKIKEMRGLNLNI
ncbi:UNVERIFIED_CONTAM: hypothetical protein Slati_3925600 [Sesamum latifolium]|uniref:FAR1 domain-containing protein n=1 Tax=Sesamum latifolium TaxID=2727402 RepID=A0AAW2TP57_9LAMI